MIFTEVIFCVASAPHFIHHTMTMTSENRKKMKKCPDSGQFLMRKMKDRCSPNRDQGNGIGQKVNILAPMSCVLFFFLTFLKMCLGHHMVPSFGSYHRKLPHCIVGEPSCKLASENPGFCTCVCINSFIREACFLSTKIPGDRSNLDTGACNRNPK